MNVKTNGKKIYPLNRDLMFKYIFGYQENAKFTASLLESFFNLESGSLKNIKITNSVKLNKDVIFGKGFETDIMVELPNGEGIILEMYNLYEENAEIKSVMYITDKFSKQLNMSKKKMSQLNFVKKDKMHSDKNAIKKYIFLNEKDSSDTILSNLFQIYIINVDAEEKTNYNVNESFKDWIDIIGAETEEEIKEISKRSEIMAEVYKEMKNFSELDYVDDYFNRERLIESQHSSELKETKVETQIEIAKNMITKGTDLEYISEVTNLSLDNIKKIAKEMNEEANE